MIFAAAVSSTTAAFFSTYNRLMRCSFVLALAPALLSAADFKLDHVTVAGSDIRRLQASLSAVGIASVYGGAHSNQTTEMALVSFPDGSYLELIGLQANADPRAVARHDWSKFLKQSASPCAFAVREKNLAAEIGRHESGRVIPPAGPLTWAPVAATASGGTAPVDPLTGVAFPGRIIPLNRFDPVVMKIMDIH
jgi:hypothetical protein